jgi:hypothetical protein
MLNFGPEKIYLVTYSRETKEFDQTTLDARIRADRNLYAAEEGEKPESRWLILAAFSTLDQANTFCERIKLTRRPDQEGD